MNAPKYDNFTDRQGASANARKAMLEKFRARPGPDDPAVIEMQAARIAIAVAREARAAERKAAREAAEAIKAAELKAAQAEEAARAAAALAAEGDKKARALALLAEQKAIRDARYAARKKKK